MRHRNLAVLALGAATLSLPTQAVDIGVNIHRGGSWGENRSTNDQFVQVMKNRNLKSARLDLVAGEEWLYPSIRDQIIKLNAAGITKNEIVVMTSYHFGQCGSFSNDLAFIEQDSYNKTFQMVGQFKDIIHDFEMLNEVQLRGDFQADVPVNSAGQSSAPYYNKPCVAKVTAAIKGMSRAIRDQGQKSIVGVLGRDTGYLKFLQEQGIHWDYTGYHTYPYLSNQNFWSDTWYGSGGILQSLSAFGKKIRINEFNCGEHYNGYENQDGAPQTETCLKVQARDFKALRAHPLAGNVEMVHVYEMVDHPTWGGAEGMFGMHYDIGRIKVYGMLVTAFAGGNLSSAERGEITRRGLLTDAEIDA
ncbi:MAG: hypothetical protein EOO27_29380, partial [Comamonadaceae bacterium]